MKLSKYMIACALLCASLGAVNAQSSDRNGTTTSTRHGKMLSIKIFVPAGEDLPPVGNSCDSNTITNTMSTMCFMVYPPSAGVYPDGYRNTILYDTNIPNPITGDSNSSFEIGYVCNNGSWNFVDAPYNGSCGVS